jgi:hypothetical protein
MKNIAEFPKAKEKARKLLEVWKTLKGTSKSFQPMAYGKKEVIVLSRVNTVSNAGNPMDIIVWQEIGTGRKATTYVMHNRKLEMAMLQGVEVGTTWYVMHTGSKGFSNIKVIDELELFDNEDPYRVPTETNNYQSIIIYDIEVFKRLNLYVFLDYFTGEWFIIENDTDQLKEFYLKYRDCLFIGYNNKHYDDHVMRGQLQGKDPYTISKSIIDNTGDIWKQYNTKTTPVFSMDLYMDNRGFSLKEHQGFLGVDIRESTVDFDIDRELTSKEKIENRGYCKNDVLATKLRFEQNIDMLLAKMVLCALYDLDKMAIGETNANLTAIILQAEKTPNRGDEFCEWSIPDNIQVENEDVKKAFTGHAFAKNKKGHAEIKATIPMRDLDEKLGSGGIHGAIKSFIHIGRFIARDVGSLYPNTMVLFMLLSRNIPEPDKDIYNDILDKRMKAKYDTAEYIDVNGVQIPTKTLINGFKLPLNTKYGAMGAEFNKLYDPRMRLLVCLVGQVAMFDLLEKIEPHATVFQSNTDAHYYLPFSEEDEERIDNKAKDWCERTGYTLDKDIFIAMYQRDVNNYIAIADDYKVKIKGGIGLTHGLKISKAIISNAFINYVVGGHDYREYIMNNNDLRQYQIISKTGYTYDETIVRYPDGTEEPAQKVNRSFAIKDPSKSLQIFKVKRGVTIDDIDLDEDWLEDDELEEVEVEITEQVGDDSYTLGIQRAPKVYTISNEACGSGITIDEVDKEYYIQEVEYLLKNWFGDNWKERLENAHNDFKSKGYDLPKLKEYIG